MLAGTVLIVDAAVVADDAILIEQEDFELPRGPEVVGEPIADVLDDRKLDLVLPSEIARRRPASLRNSD